MKALVGSWDSRPHRLLAELTALRTRVAELEGELAAARAENAALAAALAEQERPIEVDHVEVDHVEVAFSAR